MPRGRTARRRSVQRIAEDVNIRVCGVAFSSHDWRVLAPPSVFCSRKERRLLTTLGEEKDVVSRKQEGGKDWSSSSMVLRFGLCFFIAIVNACERSVGFWREIFASNSVCSGLSFFGIWGLVSEGVWVSSSLRFVPPVLLRVWILVPAILRIVLVL